MESKENEFFKEWMRRTEDDDVIELQGEIDEQNLNAEKWLNAICVEGNKQMSESDYYEDYPASRRGLKKLNKIAKNVRMEKGYMLVSVFLNIRVDREKIITEFIDGKEMADFTSNPYDFDYDISPDDIKKTLHEIWEYSNDEEKPKQVICSVFTKDAEQQPVCLNCEGKGFFRCDQCDGSGREQYVDGNFASGEERIKTGQCSNCHGTGKLQCSECLGSGKRQILSNQYQIVKKFEDNKKMRGFICSNSSWEDGEYKDFPIDDLSQSSFGFLNCKIDFENQELKSGIEKLYKNQKEVLVDKTPTFPYETNKECKHLFEENKKFLKSAKPFKEWNQGKLACLVEKHLAIKIYRIFYTSKFFGDDEERTITMYEEDGKIECFFDMQDDIPQLSFFKSLFI